MSRLVGIGLLWGVKKSAVPYGGVVDKDKVFSRELQVG